jgi:class 3 adenylate cyclase
MTFRIGINLGDVMVDGEDIFGEGVNIAARLQQMAAPAASSFRRRSTTRCAASSR